MKTPESNPKSKRGGRRPGSGRKSNAAKKLRAELLAQADGLIADALPELTNRMIELGRSGDRNAIEYLMDRALGKPAQSVEHSGPQSGPIPVSIETAITKIYGPPAS